MRQNESGEGAAGPFLSSRQGNGALGAGVSQSVFEPNFVAPQRAPLLESCRAEYDVGIPMRDGIRLATDLYFPKPPGRYPVLLERTPYGKHQSVMIRIGAPQFLAAHGYVVAIQDTRGRFASEGVWYPFRDEAWGKHQDGFDTVEWLGKQPWSTGKVGTFGGSFAGFNQYLLAGAESPHLSAMFVRQTPCSLRDEWVYRGGALELGFLIMWAARQSLEALRNRLTQLDRMSSHYQLDFLRFLPLAGNPLFADPFEWVKDYLRLQEEESYWKQWDVSQFHKSFSVPTYHLASWFDIFLGGTLRNFVGMRNAACSDHPPMRHRLTIGPWLHGPSSDTALEGQWAGEVDFGPEARWDYKGEMLRWFDCILKGKQNELSVAPPVRYFVMGLNKWKTADRWPPESIIYQAYYFHPCRSDSVRSLNDGSLTRAVADGEVEPAHFIHDPSCPVETVGGATLYSLTTQQPGESATWHDTNAQAGQRDQRRIEGRCLTFTSAVLDEDLQVTGPVIATLFTSSTAVDTDFVVRLTDVYPDQRSMLVCDGIQRARYRENNYRPSLLEPGRVYELHVDLWATSYLFQRGHRIRVLVNSSSFPRFDVNLGAGQAGSTATIHVVAENFVYLDRDRPSHVLLPIDRA